VLERVRRELLRAQAEASITEIAVRCGVNHLGRFAIAYRRRYGESPSVTLQRRKQGLGLRRSSPTILSPTVDRPMVTVHPFDPIGPRAQFGAAVADEISCALLRNRWLTIGTTHSARYHLRGTVRDDGTGSLRIMATLTDAATGRHLWADRWDGGLDDAFAFEERVATRVATAV
jgi:TolB-like protein